MRGGKAPRSDVVEHVRGQSHTHQPAEAERPAKNKPAARKMPNEEEETGQNEDHGGQIAPSPNKLKRATGERTGARAHFINRPF
jgi:hypothetical protein